MKGILLRILPQFSLEETSDPHVSVQAHRRAMIPGLSLSLEKSRVLLTLYSRKKLQARPTSTLRQIVMTRDMWLIQAVCPLKRKLLKKQLCSC